MRIDVFTIFPSMVDGFASQSLLGRARARRLIDVRVQDLRSAASDPHRSVDDPPFGGGAGMVLMPGPLFEAVDEVGPPRPLFLLGPGGRRFDQSVARASSRHSTASRCCAVGTKGWTSASVNTSSTARSRSATSCSPAGRWPRWRCWRRSAGLVPGVMGNAGSAEEESFARRPLGVSAVHTTGRVPRVVRARGAAIRRSRPDRALAPGAGVGPDDRPSPRPRRRAWRSDGRGAEALGAGVGIAYPAGSPEDCPGVDAP